MKNGNSKWVHSLLLCVCGLTETIFVSDENSKVGKNSVKL